MPVGLNFSSRHVANAVPHVAVVLEWLTRRRAMITFGIGYYGIGEG